MFINAAPPFVEILQAKGYTVLPYACEDKGIEKKIWLVQPTFIPFYIKGMDFNGFNPLSIIPVQFWGRTITFSSAIDMKDLLKELEKQL